MMDVQAALRRHAPRPPRELGAAHQAGACANEKKGDQERGQQHEPISLRARVEESQREFEVDIDRRYHARTLCPKTQPISTRPSSNMSVLDRAEDRLTSLAREA